MELLNTLKDRSVLSYGAIALVLGILAMVLVETDRPVGSSTGQDLRGESKPDGFIKGGTYRNYDENGRLASRLHSQRADQYEESGFIRMQSPSGVLFEKETRLPWVISASTGRYRMDEEILELSGDVEVERQAGEDEVSRLLTQQLTLDNRQRVVHTEAPVTLHDPFGTTRAVGMRGQIDKRVVEFDQRVRGTYRLE